MADGTLDAVGQTGLGACGGSALYGTFGMGDQREDGRGEFDLVVPISIREVSVAAGAFPIGGVALCCACRRHRADGIHYVGMT